MYPLLIAAAAGVSVLLSLLLLPKEPFYFSGPFLGLLAFLPTFWLISRRVADKLRPLFEQAQRQAQTGNVPQAVQSFEKTLAWKHWQLFLEKQVNTQIGMLHYAAGDEKKAIGYLRQGYPKVSEGHLVLGAALYRDGQAEEARKALELGIRFNKRSAILYNVLAWMLHKDGQREAAIEVLDRALKALKSDEETADNLERLRNDKRMNMKPFGQLWYMLRFETLPGMAQAKPFRKGFRQPPKGGKARKR